MVLGVILALVVSIIFAVYAVPRKFSKQNAILYTMWVGLAYFIGSILLCLIVWFFGLREQEVFFSFWHLLTILRGIIWFFGIVAFNLAIDKIGLTRFNQWKNFQGPIGTILMLAFIDDIVSSKIIWLLCGMTVMFISAMLFTIKTDNDNLQSNKKGIFWAVLAAFCFGITAFINKIITTQGFIFSQLLFHSFSVVFAAATFYCIKTRKPKDLFHFSSEIKFPIISGILFLAGTILSIYSYTMIPGSISWSITQLNAIWTILIGIFIFKEVSFKKYWFRITVGFVFAFSAIFLLLRAL